MKSYLVGGAVRDRLLGLPVRDRDWVVVGATAAEMEAAGFQRCDDAFPVFLHPLTGEEYALARRETKCAPGYKGFSVEAGPGVTLEQDLQRRDLTINAIAECENGDLVDPFNGQGDLQQGVLRHVSPAFVEDPVRLLRIARFAARLGRWGFRVSHDTQALLKGMVASGELSALHGERVWSEMKQALMEDQPWRFFHVLQRCGALEILIPALNPVMSVHEESASHAAAEASMIALQRATARSNDPAVRFAAAFYPAVNTKVSPQALLKSLRAEREHADLLLLALRWVPRFREAQSLNADLVLDLLEGCRAFQSAARLEALIAVADSLHPERAASGAAILKALQRALEVTSPDLAAAGLSGKALGEALRKARIQAIAESLGQSGDVEPDSA